MPPSRVDKRQVNGARGADRGPSLPPGKTMIVHSADGTRLHTEVFGPNHGYPIVLAHGITCSLRVWHEQINDLSRDFRVIAYDHRGHGRSGVPAPSAYSLDHLAADLDAVLAAVLRPGERAWSPAIRWAASRSARGRTASATASSSASTPSL